jgi:hypothetical protein
MPNPRIHTEMRCLDPPGIGRGATLFLATRGPRRVQVRTWRVVSKVSVAPLASSRQASRELSVTYGCEELNLARGSAWRAARERKLAVRF